MAHHFQYKDGILYAEDINLEKLANDVGTPLFVYSQATLERHFHVFAGAFSSKDILVAYSVKANSNISVLTALAAQGAGADIVSGGELQRALAANIPPERIVFSGVGKSRDELTLALETGIYQFNVESEAELDALQEVASERDKIAPVALRINPDVSAGGHEKISTGKSEDKFGVPWKRAHALYAKSRSFSHINACGVDVHIGSQIDDLAPFESAFRKVSTLITDLRADGTVIDRLDLGGGLGIPYGDAQLPPHPIAYAEMIDRVTKPLGVRLIFEPGRMIAGNAGILIARVTYVKPGDEKTFLILDTGMNDLIRPAFYDAFHEIKPICAPTTDDRVVYDVVGPVCETADRFAKARALPPLAEGALVAFMSAGAYGAVQSSQYNSRPLAPEVMVNGAQASVIRKRPTFAEMIRHEKIAPWLRR